MSGCTCLSVCFLVSLYPIKRLNRADQNFAWDLTWSQWKFMNDQNFKNLPPSKFNLNENFQKFWNPRFFLKIRELFCYVLQCTQRKHVHNWSRRWARNGLKALSVYILFLFGWVGVSVFVCSFVSNKRHSMRLNQLGLNIRLHITSGKV